MKKRDLFIISLTALLCGCEEQDMTGSEQQQNIALSVTEVDFGIKSINNSGDKSYFDPGDELGLYIYRNQSLSQHRLTYINPQWYLDDIVLLPTGNSDVYAYYPYDPANNDPANNDPASFSIEHTSGTDYLYSSGYTVNRLSPNLHLEMRHALALCMPHFQM